MKILQINKFHYLRGGSERYVFELTKLLEENGHEVAHFSLADDKNYHSKFSQYFIRRVDLDKFNLINIIKFFYNYEAVKNLKKLIREEQPDIAHLHNIAHQISPAIIRVLKQAGMPIVQTLHDYKLICPNAKLYSRGQVCYKCRGGKYYNCFLRKCLHNSRAKSFLGMLEAYLNNKILKCYNSVDLFVAPSRFMKDVCVEFGVPENKIKLIYNFTPLDLSAQADPGVKTSLTGFIGDQTDAARDIAEKSQPDYLLYFGRLTEEKGIGILLEAMGKINNIKLKIVGAGPDYKKYQSLVAEYKLNDRVEFLGPKYGAELQRLIKQATAIIMPSLWPENMPYTVLEALTLSKIVIAGRIGGLPEIIQDGLNGFLFTSGDSADLAGKINLVLTDKQLTITIEANAKFSLNKFNSQNHYQIISKIYQSLV